MSEEVPIVTGVTVSAPPPVGHLSIPLGNGLNVFYGKNGVGKTRLLKAISGTFSGVVNPSRGGSRFSRKTSARVEGHAPGIDPLRAVLEGGGVHISQPLSGLEDLSMRRTLLERAVASWWRNKPWKPAVIYNEFTSKRFEVDAPTELVQLGLKPEDVEWFLHRGCWMISANQLFLCDPDPMGDSPIARRWIESLEKWSRLEAKGDEKMSFVGSVMDPERYLGQNSSLGKLFWSRNGATTKPWWSPRFLIDGDFGFYGPTYGENYSFSFAMADYNPNDPYFDLEEHQERVLYENDPLDELLAAQDLLEDDFPLLPPPDGWLAGKKERLPTPFLHIGSISNDFVAQVNFVSSDLFNRADSVPEALKKKLHFCYWDEQDRERRTAKASAAAEVEGLVREHRADPIPLLDDALTDIERRANEILAEFFDPNPVVRLSRNLNRSWSDDQSAIVVAANTSRDGQDFPIEGLGSGHKRWAKFAISRALDESEVANRLFSSQPFLDGKMVCRVSVVDEPELALHDSAQKRVATALSDPSAIGIVASHSSEILALGDRSGSIHKVELSDDGFINETSESPNPTADSLAAEGWGISIQRLRSLLRTIVIVEGPQDEAVIGTLLHDSISKSRAAIIPMYGSKPEDGIALVKSHCEEIFSTTDLNVIVVLDNSSQSQLEDTMNGLRERHGSRDRLGFLSGERAKPAFRTPEMNTYLALLTAAVRANKLEHIHPYGLSTADIARLLPIEKVAPSFESWTEADSMFLESVDQSHFRRGDGARFKQFVNSKGGRYNTPGLKKAADEMRRSNAVPSEILRLGKFIESQSST